MTTSDPQTTRQAIRSTYAEAAERGCGCDPACCDDGASVTAEHARAIGYGADELEHAPAEANLGLGCGSPTSIAQLAPGERVLDLGSGGGLDCFLAAEQVGPNGHVVGVDMTPEMVELARANLREISHRNVEFRLGEIEHLPVAEASVDVVISNCVVNLSLDKGRVSREVFRVLRPGGRVAISDMVALAPLPQLVRNDPELVAGCVGGAVTADEFKASLREAGFRDVRIEVGTSVNPYGVAPAQIHATKGATSHALIPGCGVGQ